MDAKAFVTGLNNRVRDIATRDTIESLQAPPGRRPAQALVKQAAWYRSLSEEQREILHDVVGSAASRAVFGVLCVLDGVRSLAEDGEHGHFELHHVGKVDTLINSPQEPMLYELFNDPAI